MHSRCRDTCRSLPESALIHRARLGPSPASPPTGLPASTKARTADSAKLSPSPLAHTCAGCATSVPSCLPGAPTSSNSNVQGGQGSYFLHFFRGRGTHNSLCHGDAVDHFICWNRIGRPALRGPRERIE